MVLLINACPPSPLLVIAGNIRKFVCFRLFIYMTDFRFMADKDRISYFDEGVEYRIDL